MVFKASVPYRLRGHMPSDVAVLSIASMLVWTVEVHAIYMQLDPRSSSRATCSVMVCKASLLIMTGGSIFPLYICICPRSSSGCRQYARHLCSNVWGVHLSSIHRHCPRYSCGCSGMQWYLCSNDWVVHLPSIYMHCPTSISGFSIIQGIYAWLTGKGLWWIELCYANIFGVAVFKASILWLTRVVHLPSIYRHCPRSSSGCSGMQGICA